jgi:hypothetical protein
VNDLTDNLDRLRTCQLRDIELQAETQISLAHRGRQGGVAGLRPAGDGPLHALPGTDAHDGRVGQRRGHRAAHLQRTLQSTEDELAAQARLTRELQDDLLRTRMVEFESLSDRLYRVVRQAAKDTGKQVRLDIVGGSIEVDRGVLERMTAPSSTCCATASRTASRPSRRARPPARIRPARSASPSRRKATRSASSAATTAPASTWAASARAARNGPAAARSRRPATPSWPT